MRANSPETIQGMRQAENAGSDRRRTQADPAFFSPTVPAGTRGTLSATEIFFSAEGRSPGAIGAYRFRRDGSLPERIKIRSPRKTDGELRRIRRRRGEVPGAEGAEIVAPRGMPPQHNGGSMPMGFDTGGSGGAQRGRGVFGRLVEGLVEMLTEGQHQHRKEKHGVARRAAPMPDSALRAAHRIHSRPLFFSLSTSSSA